SSGQHLLELINDVLDITKIEAGSMDLELNEVNINDFIIDIYSLMKQQFEDKGITFNYFITESISHFDCDKRKIKQVLLNFLSNALKFTDSGGNVDIKVEKTDSNNLKFSVCDTGKGIKKEDFCRVFNEFVQLEHSQNFALKGTGIGLALSKKLVEMHGGFICLDSEVGEGSTFWFLLPINR
ncbi:MAG: HAMP domain-containing sensor histidine kinase, partial [Cyanobacteriota bacterium]